MMWRPFIALLLLATTLRAQENATAYEALRVVGAQLGRGALNHIVSITGTKGSPQPEKWKIVLEDPEGHGVRELEIADGKIDSDDVSDRGMAGSSEGGVGIGGGRCEQAGQRAGGGVRRSAALRAGPTGGAGHVARSRHGSELSLARAAERTPAVPALAAPVAGRLAPAGGGRGTRRAAGPGAGPRFLPRVTRRKRPAVGDEIMPPQPTGSILADDGLQGSKTSVRQQASPRASKPTQRGDV